MTTTTGTARDVLMVGSVPLADAEAVFRAVAGTVGDRVRRIPDGETGTRTNWIVWQFAVFGASPQLVQVGASDRYDGLVPYTVRPGVTPDAITIGALGYAQAAKQSWAVFSRLQREGVIPANTRFQVSLPTPLAPVVRMIAPESQAAVEAVYERRLLAELDEICAAIPHASLAIQWDVAIEMAVWEGVWHAWFEEGNDRDATERGILTRLTRLGMAVPEGVELGFHLCYGDAGHAHFVQPRDTENLVAVANGIAAGVTRPIQWLHLPVPRERDDVAYFAALAGLKLHPETELYLGLVHLTGGVSGTERRIAAAQQVTPQFGIATECGFGRRPPEFVAALLQVHAEARG